LGVCTTEPAVARYHGQCDTPEEEFAAQKAKVLGG
jgi:hypothetical protein